MNNRETIWKKLFESRKWLQGTQITIPAGHTLIVDLINSGSAHYSSGGFTVTPHSGYSSEGSFICAGNANVQRFWLWEDILTVEIRKDKT